MKGKTLFLILMAFVMVFPFAVTHAEVTSKPGRVIALNWDTFAPPNHQRILATEFPWLDEIEKRSGGKVKFIRYFSNTLAPFAQMYDAVVKGVVDINEFGPTAVPGRFPLGEAQCVPRFDVLPKKPSIVWQTLYNESQEFQKEYSEVKVIGFICAPATNLQTKMPVLKLEDMKGLKIWATGKYLSARLAALGAVPVNFPVSDIYMSLQRGIIDGYVLTPGTLKGRKLGEVVKYCLLANMSDMVYMVIMNWKVWNNLPPDIQKIFQELGGLSLAERADEASLGSQGFESSALEWAAKEMGVKFNVLPPHEISRWNAAIEGVRKDYITWAEKKGVQAKKFLERYDQLSKKYSE